MIQKNEGAEQDIRQKGIPLSGQFELTARCNLACKMCFVRKSLNDKNTLQNEHSAKEWIQLAEEARNAGMLYLLLSGGEVFVRKDFKQIYKEISMMGFVNAIYTNATMITPQTAKWIAQSPPSRMEVTLYGMSDDTYYNVCGNPDGFKSAIRGIESLLAEGINLEIRTTLVPGNIKDLDKFIEYADRLNIKSGIVNYVTPCLERRTSDLKFERLSPDELVECEIHLDDYLNQYNKQNEVEIKTKTNIEKGNNAFPCSAGNNSFWVTADGSMIPCSMVDSPKTYPFEDGFLKAWDSLRGLCDNVTVCKECMECSLYDICASCPGRLKSETGDYDKPAPYLCEWAKGRARLRKTIIREKAGR